MENLKTANRTRFFDSTTRYWFRNAQEALLLVLGSAAVLLIMNVFTSSNSGLLDYLQFAPLYLLGTGVLFGLIMQISYCMYGVSLVLSLGSLRKDVWKGVQIYNLTYLVEIEILFLITAYLSPEIRSMFDIHLVLISFMLLFLIVAIGQCAATISLKFGTKGSVIFAIICTICGAGGGFTFGLLGFGNAGDFSIMFVIDQYVVLPLIAVAFVLYVLSAGGLRKVLRTYEVRM